MNAKPQPEGARVALLAERSASAGRIVAEIAAWCAPHGSVEVRVVNVQPAITEWEITSHWSAARISELLSTRGASEIEPFAGALAARGIRFETYFAVGAIPEAVAGFVSSTGCRALVVAREHASRGRGSTLRRLARRVDVPILLA